MYSLTIGAFIPHSKGLGERTKSRGGMAAFLFSTRWQLLSCLADDEVATSLTSSTFLLSFIPIPVLVYPLMSCFLSCNCAVISLSPRQVLDFPSLGIKTFRTPSQALLVLVVLDTASPLTPSWVNEGGFEGKSLR